MSSIYAVTKTACSTFGQTEAGEHFSVSRGVVTDHAMDLPGALLCALSSNPTANYRAFAAGRILTEDARLDTAPVVAALRKGEMVEIGAGSSMSVQIRPVEEWPVRDGLYVPASELFPPSSETKLDPANLRYQRSLLRG